MSKKSIIVTIEAHQQFVYHQDEIHQEENQWLFFALSETYLPLLDACSNLEADGIPFKFALVLSPVLCEMLGNPVIQQQYIEWLQKLMVQCEEKALFYENTQNYDERQYMFDFLLKVTKLYTDFVEVYGQNILTKFNYFAIKGYIEILATTATYAYLPLYTDLPEAIDAQIELGLQSYKAHFETPPYGFWLPELGYAPGIEKFFKKYGFSYTVLDTHGVLFANPVPENGIFTPYRCTNGFGIFARDSQAQWIISQEPNGFIHNDKYINKETDREYDISFRHTSDFFAKTRTRAASGYRYWQHKDYTLYDKKGAALQLEKDAQTFLDTLADKLEKAAALLPNADPSLVCTFPASLFGQRWQEGVAWLECLFRKAAQRTDIEFTYYKAVYSEYNSLQTIEPSLSAANGGGYGEDLLNNSNDWMYPYIRKALKRMIDLAERFPNDFSLKERSLNMAAREVLLSQDSSWAQMLTDSVYSGYAKQRFEEHIFNFTYIYDSLGANCMSTEWLTSIEREHPLFADINYRIFRRKV